MLNKLVYIFLFIIPMLVQAQERQVVNGKIQSGSAGVRDVLVVNFNAQKETRTDSLGNFTLPAKVGDLLIASDYKIETKKIRYTPDLVVRDTLKIEVLQTGEELDEVVINRSKVTSESLGLPMGKAYTPAERKLETAGNFKPIHLLSLLGGSLEVDPILNAINGRTKRLKKEIKVEERELLLASVWSMYTRQEFKEIYKIPEDYTDGFAHYIVEDAAFTTALKEHHKILADLNLSILSIIYREIIQHE